MALSMDDALHVLSESFLIRVRETQDAISGLEMSDAMFEMKRELIEALLGLMSLMGGSPFPNPTVFGTLAALSRKVEEMDLIGPSTVDFSPIQAEVEKFKVEMMTIQKLSITLITTLSNKVGITKAWKKEGGTLLKSHSPFVLPLIFTPFPLNHWEGGIMIYQTLCPKLSSWNLNKHDTSLRSGISFLKEMIQLSNSQVWISRPLKKPEPGSKSILQAFP
jgi:hypothetical protein